VVTVSNHGPDAIDASPPHELHLRLSHSSSLLLDNGPGARCQLTGDVSTRCEVEPLMQLSGSQSFDVGFKDRSPTHPFVGLIATSATDVGPPWRTDPNGANNEALLGRWRAVLAKLDREFEHESVGRIPPRFKPTRAGRKLAAAPPKRIRARATLRLYDAFGDVHAYSTTFKMRRRGRR
jgi:hypothetical protein